MKKPYVYAIAILLLVFSFATLKYLSPTQEEIIPTERAGTLSEIKACGSSLSQKGGNTDNIDRNCFLEAYKTCTPAKLYQEVIAPNNNSIKTIVYIDTKEGDKCRVSVHIEDKYKFPENDIYYCYKAGQTELDNYHIIIDECKDRKPLIF